MKLAEVAIEFQEADAQVPGIRGICGGAGQNNPKESEWKQGIRPSYGP